MHKKDLLTKILIVVGALLAWFPLLAPIIAGGFSLIEQGIFRFDYMMPAELSLAALAGGMLLFAASWRVHLRRLLISWGMAGALGMFAVMNGLAMVTGLDSGRNEAAGWRLWLVMGGLAGYTLALVVIAVAGLLLARDVFLQE